MVIPCTKEIPFLEKVEKQYHDKNIVFISLSIDKQKDKGKWKEMIADKNMKGIQLLADNDFKSDFIKDYIITTIPRFILLDPEGNIISSDAYRPSNPKLIELFNQNNI
ncbi:MAG: TlpA family protein disulfide reductase [Tenacibaculum sp.]